MDYPNRWANILLLGGTSWLALLAPFETAHARAGESGTQLTAEQRISELEAYITTLRRRLRALLSDAQSEA